MAVTSMTVRPFRGWPIVGWVTLAVVAWVVGTLLVAPGEPGVASATRTTGRMSFFLFLGSFLAPALVRIRSARFTRWLDDNQRPVFVGFAACHLIHLVMIVWLTVITAGENVGGRFDPTQLFGGLSYLLMVALAVGYVLGRPAEDSSRAWWFLEGFGTFFIWLSFTLAYVENAMRSPLIAPLPVLALAAGALRWIRRR